MKIERLKKELKELFGEQLEVTQTNDSRILSGELDSYQDILYACNLAVLKKSKIHVVNNIKLKGVDKVKPILPKIKDSSLDGEIFDVVIIGGGISGTSILRELSKWNLKLLLIEKESDVANGQSSRNDGEIHPGVDLSKGSIKQSYVVKGNRMYDKISEELDVPFKRIGQIAGFTNIWLAPIIWAFTLERRFHCKVDDTRLVSGKFIKKHFPGLNPEFKFGIYNPSSGVISPYELTIAYAENAIENGARISLNTACLSMDIKDHEIKSIETNRGRIYTKVVINCAGVFSDDVAEMACDKFFSIHPRKGTIVIGDKKNSSFINTIASYKSLNKKENTSHSKGGGLIKTISSNTLAGPDAIETYLKEDYSTDMDSINRIYNKQKKTSSHLSEKNIITYFSGFRAATFEEDYILERGRNTKNIIHVAGIQSPGLTTAPAVSLDIEKLCISILKETMDVSKNENYNPYRKRYPRLSELSLEERDKLIKENPDYGEIVCRCEEVSKGEIIDALDRPLKVPTINAIKRRVRPGMGRCQGGFCAPLVAKIISEYENVPLKDVMYSGVDSKIGRDMKEGKNE